MNETTITDTNKAKTAKHINDPSGMSKFGMPKMEIPAQFSEMTDKAIAHARETCAKAKAASEEAGEATVQRPASQARDKRIIILIVRVDRRGFPSWD
jgi:hypothetical protein